MYLHLLKPGLQVQIDVASLNIINKTSKIIDVSTGHIRLYAVANYRISDCTPNDVITVTFVHENSKYAFQSYILGVERHPFESLIIAVPSQIRQVQLRQFYRLDKLLPVKVQTKAGDCIEGYTLNISAGGLLFSSPKPLVQGEQVTIQIKLDERWTDALHGEVIRVQDYENRQFGIEFPRLTNNQRQMIVQYIFRSQIEMRRKGLV